MGPSWVLLRWDHEMDLNYNTLVTEHWQQYATFHACTPQTKLHQPAQKTGWTAATYYSDIQW